MAQNREKDETLELQVPAESPLSLSTTTTITAAGCGSIPPEPPTRLDRKWTDRHHDDTPPIIRNIDERKRSATDQGSRAVNRCSGCSKRVGLMGFRCRCGDLFCSHHRYSDRHHCSYDYKAAGKEAIARQNPLVRAAKIVKL